MTHWGLQWRMLSADVFWCNKIHMDNKKDLFFLALTVGKADLFLNLQIFDFKSSIALIVVAVVDSFHIYLTAVDLIGQGFFLKDI